MAQFNEVTPMLQHGFDLINHRIISPSGPPLHGPVFFPNNPTPSYAALENASMKRHGIDRNAMRIFYNRYAQDPHPVKNVKEKAEINRELDANTNAYNPCKYPNPGQTVTHFPARRLPGPSMNGTTCAYNPLAPRMLPPMGTNDVGFVFSRF